MKLKINAGMKQAFLVIGGFLIILLSLVLATLAGLHSLNSVNERLAVMIVEQQTKQRLLLKSQDLMREQLEQAHMIVEMEDVFAIEEAWEAFNFDNVQHQRMQDQLILFGLKAEKPTVDASFQPQLNSIRCLLQEALHLARAGKRSPAIHVMQRVRHAHEKLLSHWVSLRNSPDNLMQAPIYREAKESFTQTRQQVLLLAILAVSLCVAIIMLIVYRIMSREQVLSLTMDALNEANETLETRVAERTATLLEARDKAMEASRIKSQFLANISHELRTPLNAVIGYSDILHEHFTDDPMLEITDVVDLLEKINSSGNNLLELIEDILNISRLETGQINIVATEFDLHELLDNSMNTIRPLFAKRENSLQLEYDSEQRLMRTDPVRLRQVLMHLLNNANKFTVNGSVTVRAQVKTIYDKPWVVLRVKDTGIGIRPEDQAKLFQIFSQVDGSSTRQYGGVGLGLVICQRFCQLMGGSISVQSESAKGSTFTVRLPSVCD